MSAANKIRESDYLTWICFFVKRERGAVNTDRTHWTEKYTDATRKRTAAPAETRAPVAHPKATYLQRHPLHYGYLSN